MDVAVHISLHLEKNKNKTNDSKLCGFAGSCCSWAKLTFILTKAQMRGRAQRDSNKLYFCKLSLYNDMFIFMNGNRCVFLSEYIAVSLLFVSFQRKMNIYVVGGFGFFFPIVVEC